MKLDIAKLLAEAKPGPWVYSPERHSHDCVIHTADATDEDGYIDEESGGVVGSSEWIWLAEGDANLIAAAPTIARVALDATSIVRDLLYWVESERIPDENLARAEAWLAEFAA